MNDRPLIHLWYGVLSGGAGAAEEAKAVQADRLAKLAEGAGGDDAVQVTESGA